MEVKVDRKVFLDALSKVGYVIERKVFLPVLSSVLLSASIKGAELNATDLESRLTIDMEAEVVKPGTMAIPFASLDRFVKGLRGNVQLIEKDSNWVEISDGSSVFNLACISVDEFPTPVELKDAAMIGVDKGLLVEMIDKTAYAMDVEEGHGGFRLNGTLIEKEGDGFLRMVATNGFRLSVVDKAVPEVAELDLGKEGIMVPRKGILLLRRLFASGKKVRKGLGLADPVLLGVDSGYLVAKAKGLSFLVRLMDAKFPDYRNMLVREKGSSYLIELSRIALLEAMERIMVVIGDQYQGVKITTGADYLEMVSVNPDLGDVEEKIEIKYDGEPIEIGFNPKYFIDVLQTMDSDVICLDIKDQISPCLITGEQDEGFLGLLMPMEI